MQYIDGEWQSGTGNELRSLSPSDLSVVWQGKTAETQQVEAAVGAAKKAFASWSLMAFEERLAILRRFRDQLESHKAELSLLISRETGKVPWDADGEVAATIGKLKFTELAYAERTPQKTTEMQGFSAQLRHRPHGVMAVFGPYNFPAHLPNGHIMPALLAGNTVVFKPSEQTPAVAEWIVRQWESAGLPAGVLNLVQGEKETGVALANADIDGLLFTGSSATGQALHRQFAGRPEILLALEMGGNNPLIVHTISDIRAAVVETLLSAFTGSGQRCTCARRLILTAQSPVDKFVEELIRMADFLQIGSYVDSPQPFMGPLISNREAERLLTAQSFLIEAGATALLPLRRLREGLPFISPGILDVTDIEPPDEEYFGPLLTLTRVNLLNDAIKEANRTKFGLSAGIFSDNPEDFAYCLPRLKAGIVNFNKQTTGASGIAPFGGIGCSGNHHAAGYYAADYSAYPVASMVSEQLQLPASLPPGFVV